MKAMKAAATGGMMRGPRGGMYRMVGGKKVYGGEKSRITSSPGGLVAKYAVSGTDIKKHATHAHKLVNDGHPAIAVVHELSNKGYTAKDHHTASNAHHDAWEKTGDSAHKELAAEHFTKGQRLLKRGDLYRY